MESASPARNVYSRISSRLEPQRCPICHSAASIEFENTDRDAEFWYAGAYKCHCGLSFRASGSIVDDHLRILRSWTPACPTHIHKSVIELNSNNLKWKCVAPGCGKIMEIRNNKVIITSQPRWHDLVEHRRQEQLTLKLIGAV